MPQLLIDGILTSGNPLDASRASGQPEEQTVDDLQLTTAQIEYQSFLEKRLRNAQELRDRSWPEFSNKTYLQFYEQNEKISNTYLESKKNPEDVQIASGTIEAKLNTLLSHIDNLNLTPEILAFDKDNKPLRDLGTAFTDILDRLAEHDGGIDGGDVEKRMLRQKELVKQGTVFVQDKWCTKRRAKKVLTKKYDGSFNFKAWETSWKKVYEGPDRVLLYGPSVYLGDITVFSTEEQPYVFTVETSSYDSAKSLFGTFDNWKYVTKGMPSQSKIDAGTRTIYDGKFRLTQLGEGQVEIIKYQDPIRDEFQIQINGVMMLPIGYPLSAVTPGGKINIAKQILYPINSQFAYGKSFVSSGDVFELSKVLDEMLRLFVLKTRKSITPPYINVSGKIISRRVLAPGTISQGIPPNALQPIGTESQGVTAGEYQIYQELLRSIEGSTVGPTFQGQAAKSGTTATEVIEMQRQARLSLGIIISACTLLEQKLTYLRLPIVIANYFEPIGEIMGKDGVVVKQYQSVSRETNIDNAGKGTRRIIPTDGPLPNKMIIRALEIQDEKESGYPSQRIYLSPQNLRNMEITWRCVVSPKEKESSAHEKLLFRETLNDAMGLIKLGSRPNVSGLEGEFAKVYGVDRNSFFASATDIQHPMDMAKATEQSRVGGAANAGGVPTLSQGMTSQVGAASP